MKTGRWKTGRWKTGPRTFFRPPNSAPSLRLWRWPWYSIVVLVVLILVVIPQSFRSASFLGSFRRWFYVPHGQNGPCKIRFTCIAWCDTLRGGLAVKFDSCNSQLLFVHTMSIVCNSFYGCVSFELKYTKVSSSSSFSSFCTIAIS